METLLLLVIIALLLLDLDHHRSCHEALAAREDGTSLASQVRRAEHRLTAMTDQAAQALLDEAKRWEPGGER